MSSPAPRNRQDHYLGSMFGAALGDAFGRPTEFIAEPNAGIDRQDGIDLPRPALITDDTQMSLAVADALAFGTNDGPPSIEQALLREFVAWQDSDDHDGRAPGHTCRSALARVSAGMDWQTAADNGSKGSGGIMRSHPVAFVGNETERREIASLQARMTHGHPTSTVATVAWTEVVAAAAVGRGPQEWMDRAWDAVEQATSDGARVDDEQAWGVGRDEVRNALARTELALPNWDRETDPCRFTGPGWTAEEALSAGLLIAIAYADDAPNALRRAARTLGDSDTIASLVGALLGAHHGIQVWPQEWREAIEPAYRERLKALRLPTT